MSGTSRLKIPVMKHSRALSHSRPLLTLAWRVGLGDRRPDVQAKLTELGRDETALVADRIAALQLAAWLRGELADPPEVLAQMARHNPRLRCRARRKVARESAGEGGQLALLR